MSNEQKTKKSRTALTVCIVVMVIVGMATAVFSVNTDFKPVSGEKEVDGGNSDGEISSVETQNRATLTTTAALTSDAATTTQKKTETTKPPETTSEKKTTAAPTKPQTVKGSGVQGDYACFNNSAFFGNSRFEGLRNLGLVPNVYAKVGLTVKTALTATGADGQSLIGKFNSGEKFDNIFIMFGDNEIGYSDSWILSNYKTLISTVKSYQPDAEIYVVSILPISKETSDKNVYNYSNGRIVNMNALIRNMCSEVGAAYLDVWSAMADDSGCLPSSASSDGVHFGKNYYCIMLNYIKSSLGY